MWTVTELQGRLSCCNLTVNSLGATLEATQTVFRPIRLKQLFIKWNILQQKPKQKHWFLCSTIVLEGTDDEYQLTVFYLWPTHCGATVKPVLTWLLWMEMAQASLSGSCCRLRWIPPADLNTQRSGFSTSVVPHRKRTRGSPGEKKGMSKCWLKMQAFQNKYFCYLFHDELLQTVFSRLKSHHNPTCSVDQTSSDVQVLCQHDLQKNNSLSSVTLSWLWHILEVLCCTPGCSRCADYLSAHFELDKSADGAVSVDRLDQSWVAIQGLKHTCWP